MKIILVILIAALTACCTPPPPPKFHKGQIVQHATKNGRQYMVLNIWRGDPSGYDVRGDDGKTLYFHEWELRKAPGQ